MSGATLRRLRSRAKLTQVELAARLGVTSNTVARWERDEIGISQLAARMVRLVCKARAPP
jgi:DNA-binding transcriptional regulator YiaG